jgi:hypothetical protein
MSDFISKKCDNCGVIKEEVNGWWFITTEANGCWLIGKIEYAPKGGKIDVCGAKCLIEKFSKLIGDKNVGGDPSKELIKRIEEAGNTTCTIEKTEPNNI